jgi:3-dehydroquinate synthase
MNKNPEPDIMTFMSEDTTGVSFPTGKIEYPVIIKNGIISQSGTIISGFNPARVFIITNETVWNLHGSKLQESLKNSDILPVVIEMGDGEQFKNYEEFIRVCGELIRSGANRKSLIIAYGGGVTGDLAGFAAASVMRGIPFIQIPTTLVAQTDSSIGGKTGIDTPWGKNLMGAFYHPKVVLTDPEILYTLPDYEFAGGMAEVIKTAIIEGEEFIRMLESAPSQISQIPSGLLEEIVMRSAKLKAHVVSSDMYETGIRAFLNLGHTIGHGIEAASGYNGYSHGQAVSIGIMAAFIISQKLEILEDKEMPVRIEALLKRFGLPVRYKGIDPNSIPEYMQYDKKRHGSGIRFVMVKKAGSLQVGDIDNRQILVDTLNELSED